MNGLDPKLETLLRQAKDGLSPTENDAQRLALRLQGALHATRCASTPKPPETSGTWLSAAKLKPAFVGAVLGLGVGIGVGYHLHDAPAEHSPPPDTSSLEVTPTASFGDRAPSDNSAPLGEAVPSRNAEPVEAHTSVEPSTGAEANGQRARPVPSVNGKASGVVEKTVRTPAERPGERSARNAAASTSVLSQPTPGGDAAPAVDEVEQVRRVQRALAQRQPGLALRLLNTLDREMPQGRLLEERAAARAIARCMSDPSRGALEYRAFSQRYAHSVHDKRVAGVCTKAKQIAPSSTQP